MGEYRIDAAGNDLESYHLMNYEIQPYHLGDTVSFDKEGTANDYFVRGISSAEENSDSVWSLGTSGQITFRVGDITEDLVGEFQFTTIYAPPQQLIVSSGGQVLYDQVLTTAEEPVTFVIPAECVKDGILTLDLEYPDAVSPESRGESTDVRELAVRFLSMKIDYAEP